MPKATDPRYLAADGMKRCNKCDRVLPVDSFYKRKEGLDGYRNDCKDCVSARGHVNYLENQEEKKAAARKYHHANREVVAERRKDWYERVGREKSKKRWANTSDEKKAEYNENAKAARRANPEKYRRYDVKRKLSSLGLTVDDYDAVLALQNGKCGICSRGPNGRGRHLHVDHDHETGNLRGLLCHSCNTSLGHFKDSIETLQRAINYLRNPPFDQLDRQ